MIWGGVSSTSYAITYGQKNYSAWAPVLWPVKTVMTIGLFLMLLQFVANFFRDIAASRGKTI
jgi:TRAP-type mannitol/chloroaromatic compound transport system permease small subunit